MAFRFQDLFLNIKTNNINCNRSLICWFAGHLDPSSETKDMEQGTVLELPYWIVKTLSNREVNVVEVEHPKIFKENYR